MFCIPCIRKKAFTPTSTDIDDILSKIDKVLKDLKAQIEAGKKFPDKKTVEDWEAKINDLKAPPMTVTQDKAATAPAPQDKKEADKTLKIPMKDGKVDPGAWDKKPDEDNSKIWDLLDSAFRELRCLNQDSLQLGRCYFWIFAILLMGIVMLYLFLHMESARPIVQPRLSPQDAAIIWEKAKTIELKLAELKEKKKAAEKTETKKEDAGANKPEKPNETKPETLQKEITRYLGELKNLLDGRETQTKEKPRIPFSFTTSQQLGSASAEAILDDPGVYATYQEFLRHLKADLESFSTAYFWTAPPWRWLELVFWAWMGCLVGLLFYIAGSLGQGIFKCEETCMFWTELLIAPIVVLVVFFLFALTGITHFVPNEASLTVNIGVSFIFGFAIRRTVGLLDIIKKRFFPDPSPGSSSPGS